jgi:phospholipase/carboxylesterase
MSVLFSPTMPARMLDAGAPRGKAKMGGVLMHGRDRTPEEMVELAGRLNLEGVRWLAPAAESGSWYPQRFMDPVVSHEPYLTRAIEICDYSLHEVSEEGRLGPQQLVIAGFSQGACLAVEYVMRHPGRCGNLLVFTGGFFGPPLTYSWSISDKTLTGLRVFITGSDVDEWVPEERVHQTARVLEDMGADVRLRIYKGRPHIVSDAEIAEAREFLTSRLSSVAPPE